MRRKWCTAFNAARSQLKRIRRWAWVGTLALGVLGLSLVGFQGEARATALRVGVRIEQELHSPLVPSTRNFRVCFELDEHGVPTLRLCPTRPGSEPPAPPLQKEERAPAQAPTGSRSPKTQSK